jgi:hypothetical protein
MAQSIEGLVVRVNDSVFCVFNGRNYGSDDTEEFPASPERDQRIQVG